ncbi:MAG TPA: hypothetical protein VKN35_13650 [Xanthomonadales bacterium]|nr:hypothetical protein [Xanthomonadales bacterium]
MTVRLTINRLVVDDVDIPAESISEFQNRVETALAGHVQEVGATGFAQSLHAGRRIDGGSISLSSDAGPDDIAQQIGDAVFRGITT